MMRVTLALAATIALLWCVSGQSGAQPGLANPGKQHGPPGWPRDVPGYGASEENAKKNAVERAVAQVAESLKKWDPPLEAWQPSEDYLRKHMLDGEGRRGPEVHVGPAEDDKAKQWIVSVRETQDWAAIIQLNQTAQRRELAVGRQATAGYTVAALAALLAVAWGYLRLDDWSHGRFSKWLRIGAVAALAVTALVWWMSCCSS
jgi:hypothetical protein